MYLSNELLQNLEQLLEFEFQAYPSHERDRIARISSLIDEQRQDREATSVVRQSNDPIRGDSLVAIDIRSHIPVTIKTIRFYDVPYFNSVLRTFARSSVCFVSVCLFSSIISAEGK